MVNEEKGHDSKQTNKHGNKKKKLSPLTDKSTNSENSNDTSNGDNSAEVLATTNDEEKEAEEVEKHDSKSPAKKRGRLAALSRSHPKRRRSSRSLSEPRKRGRPLKQKPDGTQPPGSVEEGSVEKASNKRSADLDHVVAESERFGFSPGPEVVQDSLVEKSSKACMELEGEDNNGLVASSGIYGKADRPEVPIPNSLDGTKGVELSIAGGVQVDNEAEKSKSPAITGVESIDQMAEDGTALISPAPTNVASGDRTSPMHIEDTRANNGLSGAIEQRHTRDSPFVKCSPVWKLVESMEVFKKSPQSPHFRPLANCDELTREGFAIAKMLHFASLTEDISNLQENAPGESITRIMGKLSEFEELGFEVKAVRSRLNEWLQARATVEELEADLTRIELQLTWNDDQAEKIDSEVVEIDDEIGRLEEKLATLMSKGVENGSKLSHLQEEAALLKEGICGRQQCFGCLV